MNCMEYYIQEERKEELLYGLSGDYDSFCDKKKKIYLMAKESNFSDEKQKRVCGMYHNDLKYAGDLELAFFIEKEEKEFRTVRKQLGKREYGEWLLRLIHLRNQYAKTAGFDNYLDYKYELLGIEPDVLNRVALKQLTAEKTDITRLKEWLGKVSKDDRLDAKNQSTLFKKVDECWNLNLDNIHIHDKNLPEFYIGECVPITIPDDIHVLINKVPGLSGFSVFMHEMGHAFYYSNIISQDSYGRKEPFNSIMEEAVALLFENQVYSDKFLIPFLNLDEDMWFLKANAQLSYLLCCAKFEESIYKETEPDFDKEWKNACVFTGENEGNGWMGPHFFVSNPGYFAAYFIAGFLAKEIYLYVNGKGLDLFDFIREEICNPGTNLQYDILLDKILHDNDN